LYEGSKLSEEDKKRYNYKPEKFEKAAEVLLAAVKAADNEKDVVVQRHKKIEVGADPRIMSNEIEVDYYKNFKEAADQLSDMQVYAILKPITGDPTVRTYIGKAGDEWKVASIAMMIYKGVGYWYVFKSTNSIAASESFSSDVMKEVHLIFKKIKNKLKRDNDVSATRTVMMSKDPKPITMYNDFQGVDAKKLNNLVGFSANGIIEIIRHPFPQINDRNGVGQYKKKYNEYVKDIMVGLDEYYTQREPEEIMPDVEKMHPMYSIDFGGGDVFDLSSRQSFRLFTHPGGTIPFEKEFFGYSKWDEKENKMNVTPQHKWQKIRLCRIDVNKMIGLFNALKDAIGSSNPDVIEKIREQVEMKLAKVNEKPKSRLG
jgi:hypothetical protein